MCNLRLILIELNLFDTMRRILYANIDLFVTSHYPSQDATLPRIEEFVALPGIRVGFTTS